MDESLNLGLMFSFRRTDSCRPFVDVYRDDLDLIREAEELGYDTIWLTEHHFAEDGYSPALIPVAAAVAAITKRVRIGFNLLLLPLHHPVPLAENLAVLDVISNGRLDPGFGQGYAVHEFAGYGISRSERLGRFVEGLDVLSGMWANEVFSYRGNYYTVDSARLVPRPVQQPAPPIWVGATSEKAVRRAGRRGYNLLGLANHAFQEAYEDELRQSGLDVEAVDVSQLHWVHVGETDDDAWAEAGTAFRYLLSVYRRWGQAAAEADGLSSTRPEIPSVEELRNSEQHIGFPPVLGSPETVARILSASMQTVRTSHLVIGVLPGLDPELTRASMQRFITDVAPMLTGTDGRRHSRGQVKDRD